MSVAESIVTFAPMRQTGWANASAGGTETSRSAGRFRNGPPDAVRMSRATSAMLSPTRHCQMAECSESMGRSQASGEAIGSPAPALVATSADRARASGMTRCPPATRASSAPSAPVPAGSSRRVRASWSASVTARGRTAATWAANRSASRPAAMATTSNASPRPARTSSAWRPMEPVVPRRATRVRPRSADRANDEQVEVDDGACEEDRVHPVEHAAVAGDEGTGVLGTGGALEERFGQVTRLRADRDHRAQGDRAQGLGAGRPQGERRDRGPHDGPTDDALPGLLGRDMDEEAVAAPGAAGEVGARIEGPHAKDADHEPGPPAVEPCAQWRAVRQDGGALHDQQQEGQEAGVEGAEDRAQPGLEPLARIQAQEH